MTRTPQVHRPDRFVGAGPATPACSPAARSTPSPTPTTWSTTAPCPSRCSTRSGPRPRTTRQFSPAEGAPGDVAKVLLSAARSGLSAVQLVAGDPFGHDPWSRRCRPSPARPCRSRSCPGLGHAEGVATYAGVPLPGVRTAPTSTTWPTLDFEALAAAVARGSLALTVDAGDLAAVRDGLLAAGRRAAATPVGVTGDGTSDTQYTSDVHGRRLRRRGARLVRPRRAHRRRRGRRSATSCPGGRAGRCTAGRCSSRGPRSRPAR